MHKKSLIYSLFPFHHQCNFLNRPTIVYFHLFSPQKYNLSRRRRTSVLTVLRTVTGLNNILIDKQNSFQKQPCQWLSFFLENKTKQISQVFLTIHSTNIPPAFHLLLSRYTMQQNHIWHLSPNDFHSPKSIYVHRYGPIF